ncbi:MAG: amidase domain-containing protein [Clostridia bacterium]|nr:amidase domain-containing protein [Clostridia bacterium]
MPVILERPYLRARAVEYARRWALDRNPLFYNFTGIGGDCTNFVSQCVLAGSCVMDYTPIYGWYYRNPDDRAPAFSGVPYFWNFMTGAPANLEAGAVTGPIGREVSGRELRPGDVIQLSDEAGQFYHTLLVTGFEGGTPLVAAHSNDALDRPLSSYDYAGARYLHLLGVRFLVPDGDCFEDLLEGKVLPPG